jgi:hypothetical protein
MTTVERVTIKERLEPAFGAGDAGGVDAIGGAQLGDCFGEVVADGAFGEVEFGGDFGAAAAVTSALQDLALAVGEGVEFGVPGFGGEGGIDDTHAAVDAADCVGEFFCGAVFEEIAACACVECAAKIARASEGGEDDGAGGWVVGEEVCGEFEAGHVGHLDVGDEDVGFEAADGLAGLAAVGGGGDDGDVGLEFEEGGECAEDHGLVFSEDDADGGAHVVTRGALMVVVSVNGAGSF